MCFLFNHLTNELIDWCIPIEVLTGLTPDISPLLHFYFYKPILYKKHEYLYLSESNKGEGYCMCPIQNVGHKLCFKILTEYTCQITHCSTIQSALSLHYYSLIDQAIVEMTDGQNCIFIKSMHPKDDELFDPHTGSPKIMQEFSPNGLIGQIYLKLSEPVG